MHEQTAETQISLDIDIVLSKSLLSAGINAQADLSLLGLKPFCWFGPNKLDLDLIFKNLFRFMEMIIGMLKIMTLNNAKTCTLCEYRIILNVLIDSFHIVSAHAPNCLVPHDLREKTC